VWAVAGVDGRVGAVGLVPNVKGGGFGERDDVVAEVGVGARGGRRRGARDVVAVLDEVLGDAVDARDLVRPVRVDLDPGLDLELGCREVGQGGVDVLRLVVVVQVVPVAVAAQVADAVGELVRDRPPDVDRGLRVRVRVPAGPPAHRQVDVHVLRVEVGLLHDEVDVAAGALDLGAVDGRSRALHDVKAVHPVEARGRRVAGEGDLLAAHVDLGEVAADVGDGRDAILRRGVDAGRELAEVHRVLHHAVVLHGRVDGGDRARDVEDVALVAHDVAHGAHRRKDLVLDWNVGDGVFLERRHRARVGRRSRRGRGRRGGGRRCRRGRGGLRAEAECKGPQYATRRGAGS
jgi:hypothetical protein